MDKARILAKDLLHWFKEYDNGEHSCKLIRVGVIRFLKSELGSWYKYVEFMDMTFNRETLSFFRKRIEIVDNEGYYGHGAEIISSIVHEIVSENDLPDLVVYDPTEKEIKQIEDIASILVLLHSILSVHYTNKTPFILRMEQCGFFTYHIEDMIAYEKDYRREMDDLTLKIASKDKVEQYVNLASMNDSILKEGLH